MLGADAPECAYMAVAPEVSPSRLAAEESETAEQLFAEHSGWIYGYCLRVLRSPEEAEDALQTTYLNACRSLNQGTRPKRGSAWLLRIAQNVCLSRLRSSGRRAPEHAQDTAVLEATAPAPDREQDDLVGLTEALHGMPEQQRKAILLREWQGLSYREIASELGLTQSAVETLIFRARRSLAAGLESPPKRSRLRSLYTLDLGGLAAAIKGVLAGSTGVRLPHSRSRPRRPRRSSPPIPAASSRTATPYGSHEHSRRARRPLRSSNRPSPSRSSGATCSRPSPSRGQGPRAGTAPHRATRRRPGRRTGQGTGRRRPTGRRGQRAGEWARQGPRRGAQARSRRPRMLQTPRAETDPLMAASRTTPGQSGPPDHAQAGGVEGREGQEGQEVVEARFRAPHFRSVLSDLI